eukprot:2617595-Prymnesium_polylepis.1
MVRPIRQYTGGSLPRGACVPLARGRLVFRWCGGALLLELRVGVLPVHRSCLCCGGVVGSACEHANVSIPGTPGLKVGAAR